MTYKFDDVLGQQLCDSIASELGYICSFMGEGGLIIASSARDRIGQVHSVASQIMAGKIDQKGVTAEEAARTPGVREGLNIGINLDGERIASFAIAGPLEKVSPLARAMSRLMTLMLRAQYADQSRLNQATCYVDQARKRVTAALTASQNGDSAIDALIETTQRVSQFIEQIRSIASMTNLLAVTASIEGARAGSIGKSFSLVGTEVKTLSNKTTSAADQIASHIRQVQEAVKSVHDSFSTVSTSVNLIDNAIAAIVQILGSDEAGEGGSTAIFDPEFAQELCDMVSMDLGYVCSFMGKGGVIVASSARERIGNIHAIAALIMSGKLNERAVTTEEAAKSVGMREGYSIGIDIQGVRIINFGIGGPLAEVTPLARVISKFVTSALRRRYVDQLQNHRVSKQVEIANQIAVSATRHAQTAETAVSDLISAVTCIENIAVEIGSIAKQTNLLAWNATFKAFHAGSAGSGFSVVANEIKALSRQTSKDTHDINSQISLVEGMTGNAREAITNVSGLLDEINTIISGAARLATEEKLSLAA